MHAAWRSHLNNAPVSVGGKHAERTVTTTATTGLGFEVSQANLLLPV